MTTPISGSRRVLESKSVSWSALSLDWRPLRRELLSSVPRDSAVVMGDLLAAAGSLQLDHRSSDLCYGILVPDWISILHGVSGSTLFYAWFWGAMWGIGGLTFGLGVRYLGVALGYTIALGFSTAFGTLMPPLFAGQLARSGERAVGTGDY